jgi:DnaJ-class molecular chaperone
MRVNLGSSEVFVTFRVKTSDKFRRDKEDIHSEVNVSIVQATLGGAIKVPGIYEDHLLQVEFFIVIDETKSSTIEQCRYRQVLNRINVSV